MLLEPNGEALPTMLPSRATGQELEANTKRAGARDFAERVQIILDQRSKEPRQQGKTPEQLLDEAQRLVRSVVPE